jgi:opacity protein-like surface antigen
MLKKSCFVFIIGLFLFAAATSSFAEIKEQSAELGIHLGGIIGDDLMDTTVSGSTPELDDGFAWGFNYTYNSSPYWGLEGRYTWHISEAANVSGGPDLDVHLFDINSVYHFNPYSSYVFYGTAGIGWAIADLDASITGTIDGVTQSVSDSDGFTFNLGGGIKIFLTEQFIARGDIRYRYIDELVSIHEENLNTFEFTAGLSYVF